MPDSVRADAYADADAFDSGGTEASPLPLQAQGGVAAAADEDPFAARDLAIRAAELMAAGMGL